jgi:hypothetical protein
MKDAFITPDGPRQLGNAVWGHLATRQVVTAADALRRKASALVRVMNPVLEVRRAGEPPTPAQGGFE